MREHQELRAKVELARLALRDAEGELRVAMIESYWAKIGDVVLDRDGEEFRVTEIGVWALSVMQVKGNPRRNDGSWSKAVRTVYGPVKP